MAQLLLQVTYFLLIKQLTFERLKSRLKFYTICDYIIGKFEFPVKLLENIIITVGKYIKS